jgi:hypothetical protein
LATPTYAQVVTRWYAVACTGGGTYLNHPFMQCERDRLIGANGAVMAEVVRNRNKSVRCFVLNGDGSPSVRFRNQQWETRAAIQRQVFPFIILPFAALEAAQIERDTINPIEVRPDQWITERHWYDKVSPDDYAKIQWNPTPAGSGHQSGRLPGRSDLLFQRQSHRWTQGGLTEIPEHQRPAPSVYGMPGWQNLMYANGGRMYNERSIHRLGDSVFRAKAHGAYRTFVSSFDYQESNPLYFLAELPWKAKVDSVDEAIRALAPPIVQQAWAQKRAVARQGDIFCIPTELTTEQIRERTGSTMLRMQGVLGTDHLASESYVGRRGVTYARGNIHHKPEGRRPDHRRVYLGRVWHLVVPNAVPRRRAGAMVRG